MLYSQVRSDGSHFARTQYDVFVARSRAFGALAQVLVFMLTCWSQLVLSRKFPVDTDSG